MRFPEFTEEWKTYQLGDIIDYSKNKIPALGISVKDYITTENMLQDFQGVVNAKSVPVDINVTAYHCGDILLSNIRPYLKKVWKADRDGGCSADVFVLKVREGKCSPAFLYHIIANDAFISYVMSGAKGVKMPRGDKEQICKYKVSLPTFKEQHTISTLLSLLDERIATQSKIIEDLELLKSAISRAMITQYVSHNYYLGDVADIYQPQTIDASAFDMNASYNVYGANGIIGRYHKYNHNNPQICIACRGNSCGAVNYTLPKSWITGNAMVINTDNHNVNKRFLFHYLSNVNFKSIISGSGQPQIVRQPLLKLKIHLPSIEEQLYHAQNIDNLCHMIENEKNLLNLFVRQKQYLLRHMFI